MKKSKDFLLYNWRNIMGNFKISQSFTTLTFFVALLISSRSLAQVSINNPQLTTFSCGTYPTPYYTLPNVTITETARTDMSPQNTADLTFDLLLPAPFEFNPGVGTATSSGANLGTTASLSFPNATTIRITFTTSGATTSGTMDQIILSGLQIRATAASATIAYYLTWNTGTAVLNQGGGAGGGGPAYATLFNTYFPVANAGNEQLICATTTTMGATAASGVGITGSWSWVGSPTATITTPSSPTTGITGLADGTYQLRWTLTNGSCSSVSNTFITVQTTAGSMACLTPVNYFANVTAISPVTGQNLTCPPSTTNPTVFTLGGPDISKFKKGDKVLVIQMKGAVVNLADSSVLVGGKDAIFGSIVGYNGAGNYEYAIIDSVWTGNRVSFAGNLSKFYSAGDGTNVQLVTVPEIPNYTVSSSNTLTGFPWNRTTGRGGVLIFEVIGTLTLTNGTISMDHKGFLGGGNVMQQNPPGTALIKPAAGSYPNFGVFNTGCSKGSAECGMGVYSTACIDGPCGGNFVNNIPKTDGTFTSYTTLTSIAGGYKGDGIGSDPVKYPYGHGAVANGGGSGAGWNSGGGGGSNVCAGGYGGDEYSACYGNTGVDGTPFYRNGTRPTYKSGGNCGDDTYHITNATTQARMRGVGGYALSAAGPRVFMGGGGGGGNGDNNVAAPGGNGGGIIIITAGTVAGTTGNITAKGQIGYTDVSGAPNVYTAGNADATGGGGAGGSVILNVGTYSIGTLNVNVNGGDGGNEAQAATCFGSGGGGGAGLVRYNAISQNVVISKIGGAWGIHNPGATTTNCSSLSAYGATSGASCGGSTEALALPIPQKSCCTDANLGPDQTICGVASIILTNGTASNTNKTITWYKNGIIVAGPCTNCPTYTATSSGVYSVKVDSIAGGFMYCSSTSSMIITNSFPTPYLGPNEVLCSPSYKNLTPTNAASFPSGTIWSWTKDGTVVAGATTSVLSNATAGTYTVTASTSMAGCGPTTSSITLTSGTPTVTGACRTGTGTLTLSATGGNGGPYTWWTAQTGGSNVGAPAPGTSYTTPSLSTTTTYWVSDIATTNNTWGPAPADATGSPINSGGSGAGNYSQVFTILQTVTLNAVTLNTSAAGTNATLTVNVRSGPGLADPIIATRSITQTTVANGFYRIEFSTPITLAPGTYSIDPNGTSIAPGSRTLAAINGISSYPVFGADISLGNMMRFDRTNHPTSGSQTTHWGAFYDYEFSYTKQCDRVPVIAEINGPSCATPTPVTLINFSGENRQDNVLLEWSTASEFNNDHFLVQRSIDGVSFETIGKVSGNGTSYDLHQYSFIDNNLVSGILYYRLVQVDYDGTETKCKVISVNNDRSASISLYPNPFNEGINLTIGSTYAYKVRVRLSDLTGRVLYSDEHSSNETITLGESLPEGMYLVEIRSEYETKTSRIVKMNK